MLIGKALAPKGVGILLCLSEPAYAPRKRTTVTLVLFGCIRIIYIHTEIGISNVLVFLKETGICTRKWHIERNVEVEEVELGAELREELGVEVGEEIGVEVGEEIGVAE